MLIGSPLGRQASAVGAEMTAPLRQSESSTRFMPNLKRSAAPPSHYNVTPLLSFRQPSQQGLRLTARFKPPLKPQPSSASEEAGEFRSLKNRRDFSDHSD